MDRHNISLLLIRSSLVNVTVAFQDTRTGSDTRVPATLFKVGTAGDGKKTHHFKLQALTKDKSESYNLFL